MRTTLYLAGALSLLAAQWAGAQQTGFHDAPAAAAAIANPYRGAAEAQTGRELYGANCAACHGSNAQGGGNIPPLAHTAVQGATDGELFWFITTGSVKDGMPSWAALPEQQRWQIVTYLKTLVVAPATAAAAAAPPAAIGDAPPPTPPFTDFRFERPGNTRRITVDDLPAPFATASAANAASIVARPPGAMPQAPAGFKVGLYAQGLAQPRVIHTAPNGDVFVAESGAGRIRVFRGINANGEPSRSEIFAEHLNQPYGIAFYPQGAHPRWVYVADTEAVRRYRYRSGDLHASAAPERIVELPYAGGHWTRDLSFSLDGSTLFVAVGSHSNVDDPDTTPAEHERADILAFDPDGSHRRIYASGIRNPSGLAVDPDSGQLWCTVNERDGLGDNLVPDYITSVREGGFYGWPWWYIGTHQDPRHAGKHPELQSRVIVPDVLLQPHDASLQIAFYRGKRFPREYAGDIFATQHGSWNKSVRAGYEVIRIPRHQAGRTSGEYQDFLTGFVMPDGQVWGRPVGIAVATDGSLLVTDDGSNSIWRVDYAGH
jgi:glucose/arabinose dehydrogenase